MIDVNNEILVQIRLICHWVINTQRNWFVAYRKFPNRGAGRLGKTLGGAIIREGTSSPSSGFLQNENRTIFG